LGLAEYFSENKNAALSGAAFLSMVQAVI